MSLYIIIPNELNENENKCKDNAMYEKNMQINWKKKKLVIGIEQHTV